MRRLALAFTLLATPLHADGIPVVGDTYEDPLVLVMDAFEGFPSEEEGRPGIEIDVSMGFLGEMTIVVAHTGFADDSTAGNRAHYVLEPGENGIWTLVYYNAQVLCRRGYNTVLWQENGCI